MTAVTIKLKPYQTIHDGFVWTKVVFAADCGDLDDDDLLECHQCGDLYVDCDCPGPTQDGIIYDEFDNYLWGRPDGTDTETE